MEFFLVESADLQNTHWVSFILKILNFHFKKTHPMGVRRFGPKISVIEDVEVIPCFGACLFK